LKQSVFRYHHNFPLESGKQLKGFELAYATWGEIKYNEEKLPTNVVWICHALTANALAHDWWDGLVGEGKLYDPNEDFIICANILGSCYGSTNALSINPDTGTPYYHQFPLITIRDIVNSLDLLRQHLGIQKINVCTGGSMGGQQALEWDILQPDIMEQLIVLATNARHSPWGIAFNESQRMAIANDSSWSEDQPEAGKEGMKVARSIALLSYRNYLTYQLTQTDDDEDKTQHFKASSYQQYQGKKLAKRFHAFAYWTLSKAMDSHQVGRNRGSIQDSLGRITAKTLVIGINTDVLFPLSEQMFLSQYIPNATFRQIHSNYGHDGFLIESEKIKQLIQQFQSNLSKTTQS